MAAFFNFNKNKERYVEDDTEEYMSISEENSVADNVEEVQHDVEVRVFVLDDYENIREILDVIRNEKTMCLIDIHLLRNKDPDELKRAIDKLKKTIEAISGELIGFHENWVLAAPKNVYIHKGRN